MVASWPATGTWNPSSFRFNPLHCGAVVASQKIQKVHGDAEAFQSPSLRGSGRFRHAASRMLRTSMSFNPLHCGAVVASRNRRGTRTVAGVVSIPFIAGQWSLRALVRPWASGAPQVSIPFIAGQWSLRSCAWRRSSGRAWFQSPSLRGSGRFSSNCRSQWCGRTCFNPLHCGAVVASGNRRPPARAVLRVSIPFIAGQWSLQRARGHGMVPCRVSIPFIAGQWSLRMRVDGEPEMTVRVSIPFIAGQWSLL